jgi:hypothetical protein
LPPNADIDKLNIIPQTKNNGVAMKVEKLNPGQIATESGQYMNLETKMEVTVPKGKRMPPTPAPEQKYILVDKTKHKPKGKQ